MFRWNEHLCPQTVHPHNTSGPEKLWQSCQILIMPDFDRDIICACSSTVVLLITTQAQENILHEELHFSEHKQCSTRHGSLLRQCVG